MTKPPNQSPKLHHKANSVERKQAERIEPNLHVCTAGLKCLLTWLHQTPTMVSEKKISDAVKAVINQSHSLLDLLYHTQNLTGVALDYERYVLNLARYFVSEVGSYRSFFT
eukprot:UN03713